jgi:molybdopterin biosynthesis enzyme
MLSGSTARERILAVFQPEGTRLRDTVDKENEPFSARLTCRQDSGNIFSFMQGNALLIVPSRVKCVPAKTDVEIYGRSNKAPPQ